MAILNDKQKRFCEEYLIDLNGTQAAIRAGYSKKTANEQAARLLANVSVSAYVRHLQSKYQKKLDITQDRVLTEFARVAFFDIRNIYNDSNSLKDIKDLDDDSAAALAGVEVYEVFAGTGKDREHIGNTVKVKIHNKIQALEGLAKHLGLFEKDNSQKKPEINLSAFKPDDLKTLLALVKKAS